MKTYLTTVFTLLIFAIPSISLAATGRPGPYFSGFLGTSFARDTTVNSFDAITGRSFSDEVTFDPGVYVGGTGGYDFGFLRLEGELSYRNSNIDKVTNNATGERFRNVDGNVGVFATMFNVFFDLHNSSRVTPYLGGGIGFANLHINDTTGRNTSGNIVPLYEDSNDTVFASQVGAGMDIAINSRYSLDVGYRYFITEKAKPDGDSISSDLRFESHNALVGFKVKF
jgi:opacity protein-like surface antigen